MVGPGRPQFVLFGSSIVQYSFSDGAWGSILADLYSRRADILLRGYAGWNSRLALQVLDDVFPKNAIVQPSLVVVYFGGNDSMRPQPSGLGPHVPLPEYLENMRRIALHLKSLSEKTRVIFLSTPPINEKQLSESIGVLKGARKNELCHKYSVALLELCKEIDVTAIDLWTAFHQRNDWLNTCFTDGIHLSSRGSEIVANEILKVLREAEWKPSLYWKSIPLEFPFTYGIPDRPSLPECDFARNGEKEKYYDQHSVQRAALVEDRENDTSTFSSV